MAKKKKSTPETPTPIHQAYRIIPPGECPYCGKGPISVIVRDQYPVVIDKEGYAIMLGDINTRTFGLCLHCNKLLGDFEQKMFKWFPEGHIEKDKSLVEIGVKPSYNFFGNRREQLCEGEKQEWIIQS